MNDVVFNTAKEQKASKAAVIRYLLDNNISFMENYAYDEINYNNDNKKYNIDIFLPDFYTAIEFKTAFYYNSPGVKEYTDTKIQREIQNQKINHIHVDLTRVDNLQEIIDTLSSNLSGHINDFKKLSQEQYRNQQVERYSKQTLRDREVYQYIHDFHHIMENAEIYEYYIIPMNYMYHLFTAIMMEAVLENIAIPIISYSEFSDIYKNLIKQTHGIKSVKTSDKSRASRLSLQNISIHDFDIPLINEVAKKLITNPTAYQYFRLFTLPETTSSIYYNDTKNHSKSGNQKIIDKYMEVINDGNMQELNYIETNNRSYSGLLLKHAMDNTHKLVKENRYLSNKNWIKQFSLN